MNAVHGADLRLREFHQDLPIKWDNLIHTADWIFPSGPPSWIWV